MRSLGRVSCAADTARPGELYWNGTAPLGGDCISLREGVHLLLVILATSSAPSPQGNRGRRKGRREGKTERRGGPREASNRAQANNELSQKRQGRPFAAPHPSHACGWCRMAAATSSARLPRKTIRVAHTTPGTLAHGSSSGRRWLCLTLATTMHCNAALSLQKLQWREERAKGGWEAGCSKAGISRQESR